mmetsp:Transcript_76782/g.217191  ORF Transcript_76782/g.217191 Transcript_76782/m.217191 type:complete len:208 (+) Transcript_76782:248-871(+)
MTLKVSGSHQAIFLAACESMKAVAGDAFIAVDVALCSMAVVPQMAAEGIGGAAAAAVIPATPSPNGTAGSHGTFGAGPGNAKPQTLLSHLIESQPIWSQFWYQPPGLSQLSSTTQGLHLVASAPLPLVPTTRKKSSSVSSASLPAVCALPCRCSPCSRARLSREPWGSWSRSSWRRGQKNDRATSKAPKSRGSGRPDVSSFRRYPRS